MDKPEKNVNLTDDELKQILADAELEGIEQRHIEEVIGQQFYLPMPNDSEGMLKAKRWASKDIYQAIDKLKKANKALKDAQPFNHLINREIREDGHASIS